MNAVQRLIEQRYAAIHGAVPALGYPHFCVIDPPSANAPSAALGLRLANEEPLFLEAYLDQPIERVLAEAFGRPFQRAEIVEIGAHASRRSRDTVALWAQTADYLAGTAEVAVAVLTQTMRAMFDRLGIAITDLGPADPARLGKAASDWGRYYDEQPRISAGLIAPAMPKLARFLQPASGFCG